LAFSGPKNHARRSADKQSDSKHTAWAKYVCPVKANARKTAGSRTGSIQVALSKPSQGKSKAEEAWPPAPVKPLDVGVFDIQGVILRGSDLEKEEQRKQELQLQRRLRTDKVCQMQATQCALRQKHDAWLRNKSSCKGKGLPSKESYDSAALAVGMSIESVGHLYSLREAQSAKTQVPKNKSAGFKDPERSSSTAETEAPTVSEMLQDLDDESARNSNSPKSRNSPEPAEDA
jgi:hypothetical protein